MDMKKNTAPKRVRNGLVAALDVGTTKVCCLIARLDQNAGPAPEDGLKIIGIGHQVSKGLRSGAIVDLEETETSIRATVETAEQMGFALMAGSSMSVARRLPSVEMPLGAEVDEAMCVGCGWIDGGDFHGSPIRSSAPC